MKYGIHNSSFGIFKKFISLSGVQVLSYFVPIITIPLLLRAFGLELYGEYAFLYSVVSYFLLIVNYGFDISGIRNVSNSADNPLLLTEVFSKIIWSRLVIFLGVTLIMLVGQNIILPHGNDFIIIILLLGIFGQVITPNWFFIGLGKPSYLLISTIVSQAFNLLFILLFIHDKSDYNYIFIINSFGLLFAGLIQMSIIYNKFKVRLTKISLRDISAQFKEGLPFFTSTIGVHLYKNNSIQFLKFSNLSYDVGIFSVLRKIFEALNSFNSVLSQAFISESICTHDSGNKKINPVIIKLFWVSLVSTLILSTTVFYFSPIIIYLVSGSFDTDLINGLRLMIFSLVIIGLNVPCVHFLISKRKEKYISLSVLSGAIVDFICLLIFVPIFKFKGAIYSVVVTELFTTIFLYVISIKILNNERKIN